MKKPQTPFPISGYFGPEYFCNRKNETQALLNNLYNGVSTTLISIRRMGKTGLIHHVQHKISKDWDTIYLDILPTENLQNFLNVLATGMLHAVSERSGPGKKVWDFIKSLRPTFSFDPVSGDPQVSFESKPPATQQNINSILQLLEKHPKPVMIAIDEFQQILNYPEKNIDAWLRSIIQQLKNVFFIFSGSRQHLMTELFTIPSRPFYRSAQLLKLEKIQYHEYCSFISEKFKKNNRNIDESIIREMLEWTQTYTYYVQLLCNRVFLTGEKKITHECWMDEANKLIKEHEIMFYNYRDLLTKAQWSLVKAVANEDIVYSPTSNEFIGKYQLGSSASVLRSLDSLIRKEMLYYDYDEEGVKYYKVYDLLLQRWIRHSLQ
ncbi:MAG: ATP-binding protein [Bacteroidetes bacterium]|nr:ATP-binding protein [Bacteroidota bacterium]